MRFLKHEAQNQVGANYTQASKEHDSNQSWVRKKYIFTLSKHGSFRQHGLPHLWIFHRECIHVFFQKVCDVISAHKEGMICAYIFSHKNMRAVFDSLFSVAVLFLELAKIIENQRRSHDTHLVGVRLSCFFKCFIDLIRMRFFLLWEDLWENLMRLMA